jgi:uncharacterized delta-60 repeat protein
MISYQFTARFGVAIAFCLICCGVLHALPLGLPDTSFGGSGQIITTVGAGSSHDVPRAVMVQADDRVLVGGTCSTTAGVNSFCMVRYEPNGVLDSDFGADGRAIRLILDDSRAYAMALQSDGKIVIAGGCIAGLTLRFCVARFTATGAFDPSFGGGTGFVTFGFPLSFSTSARALAVQGDGRIVVAGQCMSTGSLLDFCLARLLPDGQFDTAFNALDTPGRVIVPRSATDTTNQYATALAIQPDGKIVVVGYSQSDSYLVLRFAANGAQPDSTFGTNGWTEFGLGPSSRPHGVALQPNGKIVIGGNCSVLCAARLGTDGEFDDTFNTSGVYYFSSSPDLSSHDVGAVALRSDGAVVLAGFSNPIAGICTRAMAVVNSNGSTAERIQVSSNCNSAYTSVALQTDGKVVGASFTSTTSSDFGVDRFHGGDADYRQCSLDIDGDGRVLATIDGLIHTRIAIGMIGASVISGINFPVNAKRTSWKRFERI